MKKHTKIYFLFFEYGTEDFVPCECCGARAVDVHHIDARGMGGSDELDVIENLMAMCRKHHDEYGDRKPYLELLIKIHELHLKNWLDHRIKPFEFAEL